MVERARPGSTAEAEKTAPLRFPAVDVPRSGNVGHALERAATAATAATVRSRNGRILAIDGPFAETKEQLGGFLLIEARDLNEAIHMAARIPPGRLGCVEVRPIAGDARTRSALGLAAADGAR
jgi:hypothetical protein